jgi:hypothetical protein
MKPVEELMTFFIPILFISSPLRVALVAFTEFKSLFYRLTVGTLHALSHSFMAVSIVVLLSISLQIGLEYKLLMHNMDLFSVFGKQFPIVLRFFDALDRYMFGMASSLVQTIELIVDVPTFIAVRHVAMCEAVAAAKKGGVCLVANLGQEHNLALNALSRLDLFAYYVRERERQKERDRHAHAHTHTRTHTHKEREQRQRQRQRQKDREKRDEVQAQEISPPHTYI